MSALRCSFPAVALALAALLAAAPATAQSPDRSVSLTLSPAATAPGGAGGYRVDTGDRVSIDVYREPDLDVDGARVRDDGTISFPLLGDLGIRGMTSAEIQSLVTARLADGYLKHPSVTVSIDAYRLYYIKGEVARPGGYSYLDGLTVEKAVALAGGFTERASKSAISLVREDAPERVEDEVAPSTRVRPGDVITVGESFF